MGKIRKSYSSAFKAKVALETIKKERTISQLSSEYGVHANQINQWRRGLLKGIKIKRDSIVISISWT